MASGSYKQADVVCPYYRFDDGGKRISCEGLIKNTVVINRFTRKSKMATHIDMICSSMDYAKLCPVAAALEKKYE